MNRFWMLALLAAGCVAPPDHVAGDDDGRGPDAALPGAPDAPPGTPPHRGLPVTAPDPAANPSSAAKVALGRALFFDPILSGSRDISCSTCHDPARAYTDGRALAAGTGNAPLLRNTPTIVNTAWNGSTMAQPIPVPENAPMFWDNRAHSLEAQARGPLTAAAEMMGTSYDATTIFPELVTRLQASDYSDQLVAIYGDITDTAIVDSIAAFERTVTTTQTSFDRFIAGDTGALSASAQRGFQVFQQIGCVHCHNGPMFSDFQLHDLRVPGVPGDTETSFRTASLRNVTRTAPYMHGGQFPDLPRVFGFYRQATQNPADPALRGVRAPTPQEAPDVIAFLTALGDDPIPQ